MRRRAFLMTLACAVSVAYLAGRLMSPSVAEAIAAPVPAPDPPPPARLSLVVLAQATVVTTTTGSDVGIPFLFENTSGQPIRYAARRGGGAPGVYGVNVASFHDGKPADNLGQRVHGEGFVPIAKDVRELAPGHGVMHTLRPLRDFPDFDPGEYELRVTYSINAGSVDDTELKMTVMTFTRAIKLVVLPKK